MVKVTSLPDAEMEAPLNGENEFVKDGIPPPRVSAYVETPGPFTEEDETRLLAYVLIPDPPARAAVIGSDST